MTGTQGAESPGARTITRERIAAVAVELLDARGESGLTFRALARHLETGHGAIQWHVVNKAALLQAAAAAVLSEGVLDGDTDAAPREAIRTVALEVYDAIDAHPWLGAQLAKPPWQDMMLRTFERIGRSVQALGAPAGAQFTATSTLLIYIIGAGSQEATASRSPEALIDRTDALDAIGMHWARLAPEEWPFTQSMAPHLRAHDDRAEFLAGVDLILGGLAGTP